MLAVAQAGKLLASHHGGGGMAPSGRRSDKANMGKDVGKKWSCAKCGDWSWSDRTTCFKCGAVRGKKQNGGVGAAGGKQPATLTVGDFILVAGDKKSRKQAKVLERQLARLEELEAKEAGLGTDAPADERKSGEATEPPSGSQANEQEAELGKKLKSAREDLATVKGLNERLRSELCAAAGGFEAAVSAKQLCVDSLVEQLRGCKPTAQRLAQAKRHQETLGRKVSADAERAKELAALQEQLDKDKQEHTEKAARNTAELAAAKQEVGRLAAERAQEQGAAPAGSVELRHSSSSLTA